MMWEHIDTFYINGNRWLVIFSQFDKDDVWIYTSADGISMDKIPLVPTIDDCMRTIHKLRKIDFKPDLSYDVFKMIVSGAAEMSMKNRYDKL